jgi:hypothetical protein
VVSVRLVFSPPRHREFTETQRKAEHDTAVPARV